MLDDLPHAILAPIPARAVMRFGTETRRCFSFKRKAPSRVQARSQSNCEPSRVLFAPCWVQQCAFAASSLPEVVKKKKERKEQQ